MTNSPTPKVGRNAPCPCGSGRKFKKCCFGLAKPRQSANRPRSRLVTEVPAEVLKVLREQLQKEERRRRTFGYVRPIVTAKFQGYRLVGVWNQLLWSKEWRTVPDFLRDYLRHLLGCEWWATEQNKPFDEKHQILKWWDEMVRFQREKGILQPDGTYETVPSGPMLAFLLLAYEVYVLKDNSTFQKRMLRRLKHPDQFQGARYEIYAAATCIRAGLKIELEDETDTRRRHPEFVAVHPPTSTRIFVEAKSRHRPGVLGRPGSLSADEQLRTGVTDLVNRALEKASGQPYVVFVDLNLPPSSRPISERPWFTEIVNRQQAPHAPVDFSMILFTNFPHHYSTYDSPAPSGTVLAQIPLVSRCPVDWSLLREIYEAALIAEHLPSDFDSVSA